MEQQSLSRSNQSSYEAERGLLDLSVALSTRDITAGNQFALFVLVKNPFNKPVWIRRVHVSLPSELTLADPKALSKKNNKNHRLGRKKVVDELEKQKNEQTIKEEQKKEAKEKENELVFKFNSLNQKMIKLYQN